MNQSCTNAARALTRLNAPLLTAVYLAVLVGCGGTPEQSQQAPNPPDAPDGAAAAEPQPLEITSGAAAGYVADRVCAECHAELFDSYQHVAMANSFFRPSSARVIEDFENNQFFHAPSKRHYTMIHQDGSYLFKRYQLDAQQKPINVYQRKVDWIMGSGNHSRVYLYQLDNGEMYQLPIAWYSQDKKWGMAPGFDRPDHAGITHLVRRECMFCHNAYPEVPAGSDMFGMAHTFPADLPEGIGCQRCHGPGGEHVQVARADEANEQEVLASVVNPGNLAAPLAEDVCNSCHFQPSVALSGVRRFGRSDYSFRPGEPLGDYLAQMDVWEEDRERSQRFEINHHSYRLRQSLCFLQSEGALKCTTCHDPHRRVAAADRVAHYRQACLTCHQAADCTVEGPTAEHLGVARENCVDCHMPKRRTQDVVHVAMTDHLIRRRPGGSELLAPLEESEPVIADVELIGGDRAPTGDTAEIYRSMAMLRTARSSHQPAVDRLTALVGEADDTPREPLLDLAEGQIRLRRFEAAEGTARRIMERYPEIPRARQWLGLALAGQGKNAEAIEQFRSLVDDGVASPEVHHNLALLLLGQGDRTGAQEQLEQAVAGRPNLLMAWIYLGNVHKELNQLDFAADFYRRAIEIEPAAARVYGDLCRVLMAAGRQAESFRYWRHAARMAGTDQPAEGPARTASDRIALMPIPAPPLTGLEPDIASQINALQQYFTETIATSDNSPKTLVQLFATLGQLYHAHKLMDSAEACYLNAARLAPRDFRWRYLLGVLHAQQGSGPTAIDHFLAAARLQPAYEATWLRLGKLQLQRKQLDDARQRFETALTVNADSAAALYGLGQVALAAGDYSEAIPRFQAALERAPAADAIHQSLAAAYRELGQQQEADSHLAKKGSVEPPLTDPLVDGLSERFRGDGLKLVRGYVAFNAGRFEDAVEFFARAVQDNPKNARAHVNLGSSLARAGDVDGAIEHYEKALEIDPDRTSAHLSLGVLRADRKEFEAAIRHLRAVVKADSLSALASRRLAQALRQDGQDDAALAEYRRLMTIAPGDEAGMLELADLLVGREDFQKAIDVLAAAYEKNPDSAQTADALARLLASCPQTELRNGARAVELATKAYESSKREEHAEVLAMALAEAGRCDEAVAIQTKLIAKARKIQNEKIEKRLTEALRRYEQGPPCRPPAPGQKSGDPVPEPETKPDDTDPSDPKPAAEATPETAQP